MGTWIKRIVLTVVILLVLVLVAAIAIPYIYRD